MKKLFCLFVLLSVACKGYSQTEPSASASPSKHMRGDFLISASPDLMLKTYNGIQFSGGAKMQLFVGKNFSIDADFVIGKDYSHFGLGLIGIPIGMLALGRGGDDESDLTTFIIKSLVVLSSFEHLSYHIPVKENFEISPFISLLRFRSRYDDLQANPEDSHSDPYYEVCFASGIQLNKYFGKFSISPYSDFSVGYSSHKVIFGVGVYCGISFPTKVLN